MPKFSFTVDNQLRLRYLDKELEKILTRKLSEVEGLRYFEVLPRFMVGGVDIVENTIQAGSRNFLKGFRIPCLYGCTEVNLWLNPIRDGRGGVVGAAISGETIVLCSVAKELEQSRILIDIGKVAATLAHGVRAPLNAIKGWVYYLKGSYPADPTIADFAQVVEKEISKLEKFITQFLSNSSEAGEAQGITDVKLDLNATVKKMEPFVSMHAHKYGIDIQYEYGEIPSVPFASCHIEQAILNIFNNAIEAMPGGGTLSFRSYLATMDGKEIVTLEISDTGGGIPISVFDDAAIPGQGSGRGFGLFISQEVLKEYGGELKIDTREGNGTTASLLLPVSGGEGHD
jgi:two-component system, NtrC family, nitrogen regulation sensor histidine kinase GlnL